MKMMEKKLLVIISTCFIVMFFPMTGVNFHVFNTTTTIPILSSVPALHDQVVLNPKFSSQIHGELFSLSKASSSISTQALPSPTLPLESIDYLLMNASFFGGSGHDSLHSLMLTGGNDLILAGTTDSADFPILNAFQEEKKGDSDGFVSKLNSRYGLLEWSTYLGGVGEEELNKAVIDSLGNVIVVGYTSSSDFPTKNALDPSKNGTTDGFITKFDANGNLLWSTYLGGSGVDMIQDVAVDQQDSIVICGVTFSDDFPIVNGFDNTLDGFKDGFVAKISFDGELMWSTYLGGSNQEQDLRITTDKFGNVVVTGSTVSDDFPMKNATDPSFNGGFDLFITKFHPNGQLLMSTYLGGTGFEYNRDVASDDDGNILLTGRTSSSDFPTENAIFPSPSGGEEAYLVKLASNGTIIWSTFIGGSNTDTGIEISVFQDQSRQFHYLLVGSTDSNDFPLLHPQDHSANGNADTFIMLFSSEGTLEWSTYLGGSMADSPTRAIISSQGETITMGGTTSSSNFPVRMAWDDDLNGTSDVFIASYLTLDGDFDDDDVTNLDEYFHGTQWNQSDTDHDGMPDGWELSMGLNATNPQDAKEDHDNDLMPNLWEYQMGLNASNPLDATMDPDNDHLDNAREYFLSLDARDPDTDDDYLLDGEEVFVYLTNPLDPDTDDDGLGDGTEVLKTHTNPLSKDTDGDGKSDAEEISSGDDPTSKENDIIKNQEETRTTTANSTPLGWLLEIPIMMGVLTLIILMKQQKQQRKQ